MSFPETTVLTRTVRRSIMVILIISFFIIAPLVVLYTMGYRFDFNTKTVKTTGVLSIDALPKKATVTLNNLTLQGSMPYKLFNRTPGTYSVSISADGFHTWKKDISIESNQTTYIRGLTLFKQGQLQKIQETSHPMISFSPNGTNAIAIDKQPQEQFVILYNILNKTSQTLTTSSPKSEISILWGPNKTDFVVVMKEDKKTRLFAGSTQQTSTSVETTFSSNTNITYQWIDNTFQGNRLMVSTPSSSFSISNAEITPTTMSYAPIWYTDNGTDTWTYSTTTQRIEKNKLSFSVPNDVEKIIFATPDHLLYQTKNNNTLVTRNNDNTETKLILPGPNHLYLPETKEWVTYDQREISILYADGTYNTIYRTEDQIIDVEQLEDTGVILIAKKHQLLGFNPGFYTSQVLLDNITIESVGVDQTNRIIYILGTKDNVRGIYSLEY